MSNKIVIFVCCILFSLAVYAQDLQVQGVSPNLYLVHTVQAKENWYSVGRIYNISPKQIAPFNQLSIDKPLAIGQSLKIPLTTDNFSQDGSKADDEVFVPVRHTLQEKEWLYRVSVNYNKVPIENLEKWNGVNKDQAKQGTKLIVGYLKVKSAQSSLAGGGVSKVAAVKPVPFDATEQKNEKKEDIKEEKKEAVKEETKIPAQTPSNIDPTTARKPPATEQNKPAVTPATTATKTNTETKGAGYFKSQYEESGKSINGNAGIFKSTSGWNDGKYYALVNNIPVGTIVKVSNPSSGKSVFAKVLGSLPDMKESVGLTARISDAAAAELEAPAIKFGVEVKY